MKVFNVNVQYEDLKSFKTLAHIGSDSTYFRYFIPEIFPQNGNRPNNVLYLDCDLLVNGDLSALFDLNLADNYVAASTDFIAEYQYENYLGLQGNYFNAGVLLINLPLWQQDGICRKALDLSHQIVNKLECGDQDILNLLFQNRWRKLPRFYNYQVGGDWAFRNHPHLIDQSLPSGQVPLITHFNTQEKPWLKNSFKTRFRDLYWFYYSLSWQDIRNKAG